MLDNVMWMCVVVMCSGDKMLFEYVRIVNCSCDLLVETCVEIVAHNTPQCDHTVMERSPSDYIINSGNGGVL